MADIDKDFVEFVVKALVDNPDQVVIDRSVDERGVLLELTVAPEDMGKVIGKAGSTAKAIRTLLRVLGAKSDARFTDAGSGADFDGARFAVVGAGVALPTTNAVEAGVVLRAQVPIIASPKRGGPARGVEARPASLAGVFGIRLVRIAADPFDETEVFVCRPITIVVAAVASLLGRGLRVTVSEASGTAHSHSLARACSIGDGTGRLEVQLGPRRATLTGAIVWHAHAWTRLSEVDILAMIALRT